MTRSWNREALCCALLSLPLVMTAHGCEWPDDRDVEEDAADPSEVDLEDDEEDVGDDDGDGASWSDASRAGDSDAGAADGPVAQADASCAPEVAFDTYAITSGGRLLRFARATGAQAQALTISGVPAGEQLLGGDIRPADGKLYALSSAKTLYTIDLGTGAATLAATLTADPSDASDPFQALSGSKFGVDFNPVPDRLRVVSDLGQNLRINVATGAVTTDGALNPSTPGVSAAAYTNSFAAACRTRLFVIDAAQGRLLLQDPPNDGKLSAIGALGIDASAVSSFEIVTGDGGSQRALIALSTPGKIYDLDLATGATTNPRPLALAHDETLIAISAPPPAQAPVQAVGELLGLSESGVLLSFNRGAPGKSCTSAPITGLAPDEHALGMDVRPADGALYVLGSESNLYRVDVASGAATWQVALSADPADTSDPFSELSGDEVGVGFNPVPDRLRVITCTGASLRINVDTGATTTDAPLGGASVSALGYTNSVAGATSTTLYALDTQTDSLLRVGGNPATGGACPGDAGNPNCGVVTSLGSLGLAGDAGLWAGMDIDAKSNVALAALSLGGASTSTLYVIDLATGLSTLPPGVANGTIAGGARLRGLAFSANP